MSLGGSLWLVPDPQSSAYHALKSKIDELSNDHVWGQNVSLPFTPHMTITSSITAQFLSSSKHKIEFPGYGYLHLSEVSIPVPEIKVKEIVLGDVFFKRIFIRLERTESLLQLVRTLRSQFVGESDAHLDDFMENFDPHISLAYAEGFATTNLEELTLSLTTFAKTLDLTSFQYIVLMDCRSTNINRNTVSSWKASPIKLAL